MFKKDVFTMNNTLHIFRFGRQENDLPTDFVRPLEEIRERVKKDFGSMNVGKHRKRKSDKCSKVVGRILSELERDFDPEKDLLSDEELGVRISENKPKPNLDQGDMHIQSSKENVKWIENQGCSDETIFYFSLDKILQKSDNLVLKECEFVLKSPNNKNYLIKIRELDPTPKSASGDFSHCKINETKKQLHETSRIKKMLYFIYKKGTETPKLEEKCDIRQKFQSSECQCKNQPIKNNASHNRVQSSKSNHRRHDQKKYYDRTQRTDIPTSANNKYGMDEIRFLSELWNVEGKDDTQSESLETKLAKKEFFEKFLLFLQENKNELRRQYQQYKMNNSWGNGDCLEND